MNNGSVEIEGYEPYVISELLTGILMTLYALVMVISVGGNCIVCYIIFSMRGLQTVPNFFIVTLSMSDIIMTCLCIPFTVLSNIVFYYWPFWSFLCPTVGFLQLLAVLQRTFTLVAATCDCHYVTWRPLKKRISKFKAKCVIACLWISAGCVSLPTAIHSKIEYLPKEPGSKGICIESWDIPMAKYWYSMIIMLLQYFVPLTIMIFTYIHVGFIIWIKRVPGEADSNRDRRLAASKRKTIKMLVVVVLYYAIAWLPLHVITLVGDTHQEIYNYQYVHVLWLFSQLLAFSNAGSGPIIYGWMNPKFRSGYWHVFSKLNWLKSRKCRHKSLYRTSTKEFSFTNHPTISRSGSGIEMQKRSLLL